MKKLIALMCLLSFVIVACGPKAGPVTNADKEGVETPDDNIDWDKAPEKAADSPAEPAAEENKDAPASKPSEDAPTPK